MKFFLINASLILTENYTAITLADASSAGKKIALNCDAVGSAQENSSV